MCRAKRSGNTMMVSSASDPQISVRGADRTKSGIVLAADLADDELLAPRHRQRFGHVAQEHFPMRIALGAHVSLEAANCIARHEAISMHAHETRAEFLLELGERFLEQIFAVGRPDRDVLELRLEIDDFLDRHEHDARTLGDRQETPRRRRQAFEPIFFLMLRGPPRSTLFTYTTSCARRRSPRRG